MKSAYELAMERLEKDSPAPVLTEEQRQILGQIDDKFKARIAEKEVFLGDLLIKAQAAGNAAEILELEDQLGREIPRIRRQWESEKERARTAK